MPDCHAFCSDIPQAIEEIKKRFDLSRHVLKEVGIDAQDYEMAIRFTEDFYNDNRQIIEDLVKKMDKPVLVEMWKERFFYFVLKWEFNYVDNLGKASALSTDQIDVENGQRYGIKFFDENKKNWNHQTSKNRSHIISPWLWVYFKQTCFRIFNNLIARCI